MFTLAVFIGIYSYALAGLGWLGALTGGWIIVVTLGCANEPQYVGSETCRTCHVLGGLAPKGDFQSWKDTAMGRAFLDHPKTPLEARGCEACHGPGRAHVEGGGDITAILRFGEKSNLSAQEQNAP